MTYRIPSGLPVGQVAICRSVPFTTEACGSLTITAADGAMVQPVPVVEGLTELEAITRLRDMGFVVSVERRGLDVGDPGDGRVLAQEPVSLTELEVGSTVQIVVGQVVE